jgi:hypothetical protein
VTTLLFFVFGILSLWEGFKEDGDSEELAEVEAELDANFKSNKAESKSKSKANDDKKKQQRPFVLQFFSPIFIKAFSITFFGEWGDKSPPPPTHASLASPLPDPAEIGAGAASLLPPPPPPWRRLCSGGSPSRWP